MKYLIIFLFSIVSTSLLAQNIVIWKGGTPGKERRWNEPRNWSTSHIPDEKSHVIIKATNSGHQSQPIVKDKVLVASIEIHSGGILIVEEEGEILIDGEYTYSQGIVNYGGSLINDGKIELTNTQNIDFIDSDYFVNKESSKKNLEYRLSQMLLNFY